MHSVRIKSIQQLYEEYEILFLKQIRKNSQFICGKLSHWMNDSIVMSNRDRSVKEHFKYLILHRIINSIQVFIEITGLEKIIIILIILA